MYEDTSLSAVNAKAAHLKSLREAGYITWQDGHIYEIQRLTDIRRAASLKAGGAGLRYT